MVWASGVRWLVYAAKAAARRSESEASVDDEEGE